MSEFNGNLLYLDGATMKVPLPLKYVRADSYDITPNRVQDMDSTRNANGVLVRNTVQATASTITFNVVPMYDDELVAFWEIIKDRFTIPEQKKLSISYYVPLDGTYKKARNVYIPDIKIPIKQTYKAGEHGNKATIRYGEWTLEFIEYGD